jgi:hypothetical protein
MMIVPFLHILCYSSTYIFTMDSLGGKHPAAIKRLQKYLRLEAEDKRNVSKTSEALGKQAIVRFLQMNYYWTMLISLSRYQCSPISAIVGCFFCILLRHLSMTLLNIVALSL